MRGAAKPYDRLVDRRRDHGRHRRRYNGKLVGGATYGAGMVGQAFSLNGAGAYVQAPKSAAWGFGSKDFTIALWVNFNSVNSGPEGAACCSFTSTGPTSDRYF